MPVATDLQAQLADLGITATLDVQESTAFIDNADLGNLPGIHVLGWGADYPDVTNFLNYHFGSGASAQFGDKFPEITDPFGYRWTLSTHVRDVSTEELQRRARERERQRKSA